MTKLNTEIKDKLSIVLTILVLFLVVFLSGCQSNISLNSQNKETNVCDTTEFLKECDILIEEFNDLDSRASSTYKISLSPIIGEMQDVKRELKYLEVPTFCNNTDVYKHTIAQGMEYTIQTYLDFLINIDYTLEAGMELATEEFKKAQEYRKQIGNYPQIANSFQFESESIKDYFISLIITQTDLHNLYTTQIHGYGKTNLPDNSIIDVILYRDLGKYDVDILAGDSILVQGGKFELYFGPWEESINTGNYSVIAIFTPKSQTSHIILNEVGDEILSIQEELVILQQKRTKKEAIDYCLNRYSRDTWISTCLENEALNSEDVEICLEILDEYKKESCIGEIAEKKEDVLICLLYDADSQDRYDCITNIADKKLNYSVCTQIRDDDEKSQCFQSVFYARGDTTYKDYCMGLNEADAQLCIETVTS